MLLHRGGNRGCGVNPASRQVMCFTHSPIHSLQVAVYCLCLWREQSCAPALGGDTIRPANWLELQ